MAIFKCFCTLQIAVDRKTLPLSIRDDNLAKGDAENIECRFIGLQKDRKEAGKFVAWNKLPCKKVKRLMDSVLGNAGNDHLS